MRKLWPLDTILSVQIIIVLTLNAPESDYKLYIHETDYKCKRPIIIFLMALSHWSIQQIRNKIIIQKIQVKTSG